MKPGDTGKEFPRRIFIRRTSRHRVLVNQVDIETALADRGFAVIEPDRYSLGEQASLFANAEVIIGATGSAFANLIFCSPEAHIVILAARHPDISYWYWQNLACACKQRVSYVLGTIDPGDGSRGINADFSVRLQDVLEAI